MGTRLKIDAALEDVRAAVERGDIRSAISIIRELHPADGAESISDLSTEDQASLLKGLDSKKSAEILEEMGERDAAEVASTLPPGALAEVLDEMRPDIAADILLDLPQEHAEFALQEMEDAEDVRPLMKHRHDTAGGLMTSQFLAFPKESSAEEVISHIRSLRAESNVPYYLYAIDSENRLVGVIGLRDLIVSGPSEKVESIMSKKVISVPADLDQEEVANLMKHYRLAALPVVDDMKRLVGVIHSDDIVFVLEEEATEDIYRLANVSSGGQLQVWSPLWFSVRKRLPWLYINLLTAFLAAWVVSFFEETIAKLAVLASLMGIIAGQGGNAGTQTLAIMVRSIALGEIKFKDTWDAILKEALIGAVQGVAIGVAVGIGAWVWKGMPLLGLIVGLAMIGNMLAAAIAGTIVPLTLKAVRLDPALASSVLVTTVTDCVGFGLFLGLATVLLI